MPLYEFSCDKCAKVFEELASEYEAVQCPSCGSRDTHRLMSACCRRPRGGSDNYSYSGAPASTGCGGCSGGNCGSCGR